MFRALVVDDHAGFRGCVCEVLRAMFPRIAVDEAGDGPEALLAIRDSETDLVLLDIKLPSRNGIELTKAIKAYSPSTTVVILTGYDLPQYREAAFCNGADDFIDKGSPSCMNDVLDRVGDAMLARKADTRAMPIRGHPDI